MWPMKSVMFEKITSCFIYFSLPDSCFCPLPVRCHSDWHPLYSATLPADGTGSGRQTTAMSALFVWARCSRFLIYFRFIFGYFMRNFERQADALRLYPFQRALFRWSQRCRKLRMTSGQPANKPNWHHYSIGERINFLAKMRGRSLLDAADMTGKSEGASPFTWRESF